MKLATHNELLMMSARELKAYHKKLAKAEQEAAKLDLELKQAENEEEIKEKIEARDWLLTPAGQLASLQSKE